MVEFVVESIILGIAVAILNICIWKLIERIKTK